MRSGLLPFLRRSHAVLLTILKVAIEATNRVAIGWAGAQCSRKKLGAQSTTTVSRGSCGGAKYIALICAKMRVCEKVLRGKLSQMYNSGSL